MLEKFNPSRLKLARTRRKLTLKALADKVGLSSRMVSEYEKERCKYTPPEETVTLFVQALRYPRGFLLNQESIEPINREAVSFRHLKSMRAAQEHAAISAGDLGVLINEYFERSYNLPPSNLPNLRGLEPEAAAAAIRDSWKLGCLSIGNMVRTLEKHGVRVFSLAENTQDVDAFSFWDDKTPYVFLNTQKSAERSRFDAAHELGHLLLHKHGTPQGQDIEKEADRFASFFLMPRETLLPYKGKGIAISNILSLKKNWKVSAMSLIVQMKNVGVLSEWQYKSLIIAASKLGLRTKEINGIARERSLIIEKLLNALSQDGDESSLNRIAQDLNLPVDEVGRLLFNFDIQASEKKHIARDNKKQRPTFLHLVT